MEKIVNRRTNRQQRPPNQPLRKSPPDVVRREPVIHKPINKSSSADSRATKMLIDMMNGVERKVGMTPRAASGSARARQTNN
jgi:hypothetical protein